MSATRKPGINKPITKEETQVEGKKCQCGAPIFEGEEKCRECRLRVGEELMSEALVRKERAKGTALYAATFCLAAMGVGLAGSALSSRKRLRADNEMGS